MHETLFTATILVTGNGNRAAHVIEAGTVTANNKQIAMMTSLPIGSRKEKNGLAIHPTVTPSQTRNEAIETVIIAATQAAIAVRIIDVIIATTLDIVTEVDRPNT